MVYTNNRTGFECDYVRATVISVWLKTCIKALMVITIYSMQINLLMNSECIKLGISWLPCIMKIMISLTAILRQSNSEIDKPHSRGKVKCSMWSPNLNTRRVPVVLGLEKFNPSQTAGQIVAIKCITHADLENEYFLDKYLGHSRKWPQWAMGKSFKLKIHDLCFHNE